MKKQLGPINLYDRIIKNGKFISEEQFKDFMDNELSKCLLTQRQSYMVKNIYYNNKTISSFAYEFGYSSPSIVSREIKAAVAIIRAYLNFKYATVDDPITYIVNDRIIEESFDIEKTWSICNVMSIFESDGVYGRYDEIIFYFILKKFEFDNYSIFNLNNKAKIPSIQLYLDLYGKRSEPKFLFSDYQHLFAKNIQIVLHKLAEIFPNEFIPSSIPVACQYLKSEKFRDLMGGRLVESLIKNPDVVLFSEEYFDNLDIEDCTIDYIKDFYPLTYYVVDNTYIEDWTIKGLFDWRIGIEFGTIKSCYDDYRPYENLTNQIMEVNPTIKNYYNTIWKIHYDAIANIVEA